MERPQTAEGFMAGIGGKTEWMSLRAAQKSGRSQGRPFRVDDGYGIGPENSKSLSGSDLSLRISAAWQG